MTTRNPGTLLYEAYNELGGDPRTYTETLKRELYDFHSTPRHGGSFVHTLWTESACDVAMCLYEAICDAAADSAEDVALRETLQELWDGHGAFGIKRIARYAGLEVDALWTDLGGGVTDGVTFDWQFCPFILNWIDCAGVDSDQKGRLLPGALDAARKFCDENHKRGMTP